MTIPLFIAVVAASAQGGFSFMNLPSNPRVAGLGGYAVSPGDGDITLSYHNPATLDSVDLGDYAFMFNPYFADINRFMFVTNSNVKGLGAMTFGVVFMNYGTFDEFDAIGNRTGEFKGSDYVLYVGKSHTVGSFSLGANVKYAGSVISQFGSHAMSVDIGGLYRHPVYDWTIGMAIRNAGFILVDNSVNGMSLPFDIELGTTVKPEHMPIRFTITANNLIRNREDLFINYKEPSVANEVFRYLNLGTEILLGKNVEVLLGYNHRRREELKMIDGAFGAGFSYGFLIRIKEYELRFTQTRFHAAGGSSFFSLGGNINSMKKIF